MSSMKSGFSTLNRWLGKKNKDKNTPNGKLSKSNTNLSSLSVSSMNINETSQLEYNRITPLPAATSNAPFEQTFRITVLLPKEQLYVARLGARVPMSKLLELVCDNKLLDAQKYEFRNPVDSSQVYSCDLTIGAVGLSEIRLCHKSESYDTFNADEVIKLHRTAIIRDSLSSSSEFSSRHSKLTTKTPSPYSSTNSLNSMDSTGMNYTRTPVTPPAALTNGNNHKQQHLHQSTISLMAAPPRKKRVAPRPPSQSAIPEKSALEITRNEHNNNSTNNNNVDKQQQEQQQQLTRRDLCVSTPNLSNGGGINFKLDCNGNRKLSNGYSNGGGGMGDMLVSADDGDDVLVALRHSEAQRNTRNSFAGSVQTLYTSTTMAPATNLPEPSPRKRMQNIKKKSAAPAPPSRGSGVADDTISIASTTVSLSAVSEPPDSPIYASPMPRKREVSRKSPAPPTPTSTRKNLDQSFNATTLVAVMPKPVPRSTTTTLLNAVEPTTPISETPPTPPPVATIPTITSTTTSTAKSVPDSTVRSNANNNNVSKVLLNRTPTPEPRSLTTTLTMNGIATTPTTPTSESSPSSHGTIEIDAVVELDDDDNASKQADSGIGEPVPSPLPDSLPPSESSAQEFKSAFESSSDDDDMIKVYNFKLGKTVIKPLTNGHEPSTLEELALLAGNETDSAEHTPVQIGNETETPTLAISSGTELTSWNFAIPISPPPNFADSEAETKSIGEKTTTVSEVVQDTPITPKIKTRPVLNFETLASDELLETTNQSKVYTNTLTTNISAQEHSKPSTPCTPMNDIVDELSTIIQEKRIDTLIKKPTDQSQTAIEAAKPNTLTNFSIGAATTTTAKPSRVAAADSNLAITPPVTPATPESTDGTQEKLYRRNSATQQSIQLAATRRRSITRADSFQATTKPLAESMNATATTLSGLLNRRSSSQISLTKMEQNEMLNRRRSSSELSIGESPTLQSPEVIKTILGSRKNSVANVSDIEKTDYNTTVSVVGSVSVMSALSKLEKLEQTAAPTVAATVEESELNTDVEVYGTTTTTIRTGPQKSAVVKSRNDMLPPLKPISKPEQLPKTYRYSGPPSINFSTWNERPKVQVQAIKNEGDYIFGGKHANRHSTVAVSCAAAPAVDNNDSNTATEETTRNNEKLTIDTAAPILRMGIPRKEFKVPITVKPLRDISPVDNKSLTEVAGTDIKKEREREMEPKSLPVQLATNRATTTTTINRNQTNEVVVSRQTLLKPTTATTTTVPPVINASTLPRVAQTNRYTMPAAASHVLLRTTSISQLNSKEPVVTPTEQAATVVPFGQGTLRRTGIKEKMLAREQQEQELAMRNAHSLSYTNTNGNATTATLSPPISPKPASVNKTIFKSAKLELKLQQNSAINQQSSPAKSALSVTLKQTPPTKVTISTQSAATPVPPPPPAPATPLSLLKPVPLRSPTPGSTGGNIDPRSQMLEAIRNFKREELNHNN